MNHWNTHTNRIKKDLTSAGYTLTKNVNVNHWEIKDRSNVVFTSKSLGDVIKLAENKLGL